MYRHHQRYLEMWDQQKRLNEAHPQDEMDAATVNPVLSIHAHSVDDDDSVSGSNTEASPVADAGEADAGGVHESQEHQIDGTGVDEDGNNIRRVFLRYESSQWEEEWLQSAAAKSQEDVGLDFFVHKGKICEFLMENNGADHVRDFMLATCNYQVEDADTCVTDDTTNPVAIRSSNFEVSSVDPVLDTTRLLPTDIGDQFQHVFSRFVYLDKTTNEEFVEYIEPLVSLLRHPLTCCEHSYPYGSSHLQPQPAKGQPCQGYLTTSKTYIVPPPATTTTRIGAGRKLMFSSGSSSWASSSKKASIGWLHDVWQRQGLVFDKIFATGRADTFGRLPTQHKPKVDYHKAAPDEPLLPKLIQGIATKQDFVMLAMESGDDEEEMIQFLLDPNNKAYLEMIDELCYKFYLKPNGNKRRLSRWFDIFATLRRAGVRTHSLI